MRSFLTSGEEAVYGRFAGPPERAVLERFFFLDDVDRELVGKRRGDHNRLGFGVQLVTVRYLGRFLEDPLDVPTVVVDDVASQVGVADPSCLKAYLERRPTRFEHQEEICEVYGYRPYASAKARLLAWVGDQAWATGDGPKALFYSAVALPQMPDPRDPPGRVHALSSLLAVTVSANRDRAAITVDRYTSINLWRKYWAASILRHLGFVD